MRIFQKFIAILIVASAFNVCSAQEKAGTTLLRALGQAVKRKPHQQPQSYQGSSVPASSALIHVQSQADYASHSGERKLPDSVNGGKLKPWGESASYVENGVVKHRGHVVSPGQIPVVSDDQLAELPPLPDLRTPDQVSKVEKKRAFLLNKFASRRLKTQQLRNSEVFASPTVAATPPNPGSALVQVQSDRTYAVDHGNRARPITKNGGLLKPFNSSSSFVQNGELKFQHNDTEFVETHGSAGTNDGFGEVLPPLPDLRTPDQVGKGEKLRNMRILKYQARQIREAELRRR